MTIVGRPRIAQH